MKLQGKEAQKDYGIQEIRLERTYSQRMSVNSGPKATQIIGQRKAFYRRRIPEYSCARKETARSGERKIMQSIRITSRPTSRKKKWNQMRQF